MNTQQEHIFTLSSLWEQVMGNDQKMGNAQVILEKLEALQTVVDSFYTHYKENIESPLYSKVNVDHSTIQNYLNQQINYQRLTHVHLKIGALIKSYRSIDLRNFSTVTAFAELLANNLKALFLHKDDAFGQELFDRCADLIESLFVIAYYIKHDEEAPIFPKIKEAIFDVTEFLSLIFGLNEIQKHQLYQIINKSELVSQILLETEKEEKLDIKNYFKPENIQPKLTKIEHEFEDVTIGENRKIKDLHLSEIINAGMGFSSINLQQQNQLLLSEIRSKIEIVFEAISKTTSDNLTANEYLNKTKETILNWFVVPQDFRPSNWIELAHYIISNIQSTLEQWSYGSSNRVLVRAIQFVSKMEYILSTLDNDSFKLLITPKEHPEREEFDLPNLLEPEFSINEKQALFLGAKESEHVDLEEEEDLEFDENDQEPTLTIGSVIEYLCFDPIHGAMAKLEPEHSAVIHDLHYRQWFGNRWEQILDDISAFFSTDTLMPLWEELKAMLLHEDGLNLGKLIDFVVEKGVELINKLLTFLKETVSYVVDELFTLVKAIIAFFQKADIPPAARDLLKKLPPFKDLPDEVSLLHVLAAIPYTLYQEFVNFEVPPKAQTA